VFTFTLPFAVGMLPDASGPPVLPDTLRGCRVLVVDDNATNCRVLHEMLRTFGMTPLVAESAERALALIADFPGPEPAVSLALLDMQMAGMDGLELAVRLHAIPGLSRLPTFLLSSVGERPERESMQAAGVTAYIAKPLNQSELLNAILGVVAVESSLKMPAGTAQQAVAGASLRILLAEDNTINQRLAIRVLEKLGHAVTLVQNGVAAIEAWRHGSFDVVLMDLQMPLMDGLEATSRIRQEEDGKRHTPIVAMTAHAMQGDRERCLDGGMDGYVSKPIMVDELQAEIARVTSGSVRTVAAASPVESERRAFDLDDALRRLQGDRELLREIAEIFQQEMEERLDDIGRAIQAADPVALSRAAHKLKGEAANFSARTVVQLAAELELLGELGNVGGARDLQPPLDRAVRQLGADLCAFVIDAADVVS
jgi:CheY-like chemotaxis protein/HPt (histidine-containing phosphotransfer) domain-containing protein